MIIIINKRFSYKNFIDFKNWISSSNLSAKLSNCAFLFEHLLWFKTPQANVLKPAIERDKFFFLTLNHLLRMLHLECDY